VGDERILFEVGFRDGVRDATAIGRHLRAANRFQHDEIVDGRHRRSAATDAAKRTPTPMATRAGQNIVMSPVGAIREPPLPRQKVAITTHRPL
jgi:hypothetical protein